jgi:arylsulfatase
VATANPTKLKELQDLFWVEASTYQVLPLDASAFTRYLIERPSSTAGRTEFTYANPVTGILPGNEPNILNKSYTITAEVTIPQGGGEGVLVTEGGRFGGYGLYVLKGKPVLVYNLLGLARYRWEGLHALPPGNHTIAFQFDYQGSGPGKGGAGALSVDGSEVARRTIPNSVPIAFGVDESFDVGSDTGTPVEDKDYQVPFAFNGTLNKLAIRLQPVRLSASEQKAVQDTNGRRD